MNIDLKLKTYEQLQDEVITLITNGYLKDEKIEQLQFNWNSLREYIKENGFYERQDIIDAICNPNEDKLIYIDDVLDKMSELEGEKDK